MKFGGVVVAASLLAGLVGMAGCGSSDDGAGASSSALKGVAFSPLAGRCEDLSRLGLAWYYNWSAKTDCTGGPEYVPQIWGSWQKLNWVPEPSKAIADSGASTLLGFNEPDFAEQANLSVDEALALWPSLEQTGAQLGSPATAQREWLEGFMAGARAKGLRVDFIAMHWYGWDAGSCNDVSSLEDKIQWAEQWGRPIWITEWSCRVQPTDVVEKFYSDSLAMFKKHPLVHRYAWFLTRAGSDPNHVDFTNASLLDGTGAPSGLGNRYIAAPAHR